MLLSEGRDEEFIAKCNLFFSRHFTKIQNRLVIKYNFLNISDHNLVHFRDELHAVVSAKRLTGKNRALSEIRSYRREPTKEVEDGPSFEPGLGGVRFISLF